MAVTYLGIPSISFFFSLPLVSSFLHVSIWISIRPFVRFFMIFFRKRYHLAIKFLNRPLRVDFFFFDADIGSDILEVKGRVTSESFTDSADRVDGSASGTGSSGKPTEIFFPPTSVAVALVIGDVNLIVVIVFVVEKKKENILSKSSTL